VDAFLDEHGGVAVFIPFQSLGSELTDDVAAAQRVQARLRLASRTTVLEGGLSPAETAEAVASCDIVLGMRLHSIVFAISAGVAAVALAYDPKVRVAMTEAGAGEQVIDLENVTAAALSAALSATYANRAAIGGRLGTAGRRLRERAGETAHLAVALAGDSASVARPPAENVAAVLERTREQARAEMRGADAVADTGAAGPPRWRALLAPLHRLRLLLAPPRGQEAATPTPARAPATSADSADDPRLRAVRARIAAARGAVVFPPTIGWTVDLVQRPHHLARAFVRAGFVAIFDSTGSHDDVAGFVEIEPGLFLYGGPHEALGGLGPGVLLWTFPYNFHLRAHHPRETPVVYDWIDDLSVFPQDRALLDRNHEDGLAQATVVASVARTLHGDARRRRPDAVYLPNAVDFDHFAGDAALTPPADEAVAGVLASGRRIVGYYGALARWFDYALLDDVSRLRPDWTILLIGPDLDGTLAGQPVLTRPNVTWIGPRPYAVLPRYLQLFDVAMIPFAINAITLATSPLKLFEYFAAGKPVVTTPMPECMAFPEVRIAATPREFSDALDAARRDGGDPEMRARLRARGRANSWDARVTDALAALDRAGAGRGLGLY
jgi:glycosyltransferase involved in cell wall biosynthesis